MKNKILRIATLLVALGGALTQTSRAVELVLNGGFETGDFTSWTQWGNTGFTGVDGSFVTTPDSGSYSAYFGPVGSMGGISQSIATTAGASYLVNFSLYHTGGTPNAFSADFGGTNLTSFGDVPGFGWSPYSYTVTAVGASTDLSFGFRQDPAYYQLDSVSVTEVQSVPDASNTFGLLLLSVAAVAAIRRKRA